MYLGTSRKLFRSVTTAVLALAIPALTASAVGASHAQSGLIVLEAEGGLYLMNPGGGELRRIPSTQPGDGDPAWSPDGRRIAFDRPNAKGKYDIYVMNTNGSGLKQLTFWRGDDNWPRWSPTGKSIVFESTRKDNRYRGVSSWVYVVDVARGSARRLVHGEKPDWAPNNRIVFEGGDGSAFSSGDLESISPYGLRHSIDSTAESVDKYGFPRVRPDGRRIVLQAGRPDRLYTARIDGSGLSNVGVQGAMRQTNAVWSPDGAWLLFSGRPQESERYELYVVRPGGTQLARITPDDDSSPACCADWTSVS